MTLRVAILGSRGQLGSDLTAAFQDAEVVALKRSDFDVRDVDAARRTLASHRPAVVINTTAFHKVEECEKQAEAAFAVNAIAAAELAAATAEIGARFVHVSTDYVFGGSSTRPLTEDVPPAPLQTYGVTKAAGEWMIRLANPDALVVRASGLYGAAGASGKGGNFIETVLRLARERGEMKIVTDQVLSPTYTHDLARALRRLVEADASGIVHVTNSGECSWYELASWVVELSGSGARVNQTTTAEFGSPVRRPSYSALDNARCRALGLPPLRHWREAVRAYLVAKGVLRGQVLTPG
jgi:dTDP-4-dehydrorhamnose reductase